MISYLFSNFTFSFKKKCVLCKVAWVVARGIFRLVLLLSGLELLYSTDENAAYISKSNDF
jgi:hypothetical protein